MLMRGPTPAALFERWVFGQERLELPFDGGDQLTEGGEGTAGFAFQEPRAAQALFEGTACLTRAARL
ncbi:MAG: hypothetical protein ACREVY_09545 [Gammaproteobacteria bacterium]